MFNNFYISTSIAYVNAKPHIGFALEMIMADTIARYQRLTGKEVFFLTGTDEHGIKIFKTAQQENKTPIDLCNENSAHFQNLGQVLNISYDDFIRTSDQVKHWPSVQKLWEKLLANEDIYQTTYEGLYCEGCETFLMEKDLVNGNCPNHKKPPGKVAEENYFFRLSKYSEKILDKITSKELEIIPHFRQNEIIAILKDEGLKDVSFSRPVKVLPWGVPVPNDASQNMYVWCDALTNYISALDYYHEGELYQKYWQSAQKVHVIGKDIVRFHAGIWIGMLLSAQVPLPDKIIIHGFLTSNGEKMSKSLGNVVDPFLVAKKYGTEALRYFLLSQVPVGQDYDYSEKHFIEIYNAHLANNLGNFLNRVLVLCNKNGITPSMINQIPSQHTSLFKETLNTVWQDIDWQMNNFMIHKALETIWQLLNWANQRMDEFKPWLLVKNDPALFKEIMPLFLELSRQLSFMLEFALPETSSNMQTMLNLPKNVDFKTKNTWGAQNNWEQIGENVILFPRLEK